MFAERNHSPLPSGQLALFICWFLVGCGALEPRIDKTANLQWPSDPEQARIAFVGEIRHAGELRLTGWFGRAIDFAIGSSKQEGFNRPSGLHVDSEGNLFVVDQGGPFLHVFDRAGKRTRQVDLFALAAIEEPLDVASDSMGRVYITDPRGSRVLVLNANDDRWRFLVHPDLQRPTGLCYLEDKNELMIVDTLGNKIFKHPVGSDSMLAAIGHSADRNEFYYPIFISATNSGELWISDSLNFRVCLYSTDGAVLEVFGVHGDGPGSFARPKGVAVDSDGNLYVADALFGNCQIFDRSGNLLLRFGKTGFGPAEFALPGDIEIFEDLIYIADTQNNRIQVFRYLAKSVATERRDSP